MFGVSFAEQLEVFFVMAAVVSELNKQVSATCESSSTREACLPWTLVLPPWCSVAKWYNEDAGMGTPWRALFDVKALKQWIPVVEFATYVRRIGEAFVQLAVLPAVAPGARGEAGQGDFAGWRKQLQACEAGGQKRPQPGARKQSLVFSGYCDGDVQAAEFSCGLLRQASPQAVMDLLSSTKAGTRTVLLKHLEAARIHSPSAKASLHFHPALRPAQKLQEAADAFVAKALGKNLPYLAVHLRRNDFLRLHPSTTPSLEAAAARINFLLRERHLEQVFVATDAQQGFRDALRARVKEPLYYFAPDDGAAVSDLKGKEEVMVLRVLARGHYFIGSIGSSFSAAVRRERRMMSSDESTEEVFCEGLSESKPEQRCRP